MGGPFVSAPYSYSTKLKKFRCMVGGKTRSIFVNCCSKTGYSAFKTVSNSRRLMAVKITS